MAFADKYDERDKAIEALLRLTKTVNKGLRKILKENIELTDKIKELESKE